MLQAEHEHQKTWFVDIHVHRRPTPGFTKTRHLFFLLASLIAAPIITHERAHTHLVSRGEPAAVGRPREGEDVLAVRAALVARRLRVDVPEPDSVVARAGGLQGGGSSTERADIMELIAYSSDGVCI